LFEAHYRSVVGLKGLCIIIYFTPPPPQTNSLIHHWFESWMLWRTTTSRFSHGLTDQCCVWGEKLHKPFPNKNQHHVTTIILLTIIVNMRTDISHQRMDHVNIETWGVLLGSRVPVKVCWDESRKPMPHEIALQ